MLVRDIMQRDILRVKPDDKVQAVGDMMDFRQIGVAAVVDADEFIGVISKETFIANMEKVCDRPIDSLLVSDLMSLDVFTLKEDDELYKAVDRLTYQKRIVDRLPVLSNNRILGFVSKVDVIRATMEEMRGKFDVADLMHYDPPTVSDYTPLSEIVKEMKSADVKRVLVLSGEKLAGIISVRDLSLMLFHERKLCKAIDPTTSIHAEDIMSRNLITLRKKDDAYLAAKIITERNIGGIPVVNGRVEGLISRTDVLKGYQLLHT